ncbi:nose resistant to fluoxetine protein 6-like [Ylistrum balloti]|uniref:nose resistant to fluoxetine protein 6-like n=1 Tax=Ylistrum balloti TaxID=509963 RepID=UPI002905A352|nr:nose resistant to fluoxetine protein 6-like [Ylistrum balloti]
MQTNGGHEGHKYKLNSDAIQAKETPTSPYSGILPKIVLSFSVWTNGKKLLSTEKTDYTIGSINGICFFSMTWVILAHSFSSALDTKIFADQTSGTTTLLQRHSFMAISNGYVSIDSFFAMSGLLISYVFMKAMKTAKGRINWFMFFFHRFWRLTPPYMMVMMVDIALFRYLSDGPTWSPDGLETDFCKDTWWTNLLYINNFVKTEKNCLSWSWYMTIDMQFFVLSPLLLVSLYFSKKIGGLIAAIFLIGVTGASGYITYQNQLPSTQYSTGLSSTDDYFQMYYVKPYCRMGPYVVGVIIGYILYKTGRNYKINWVVNIIIWIVMSALACVILYGIYPEMSGSTTSVEVSTLYNALHRTVWGAIVCWVVFACVTGNGGFVNTFLSWSPFIVLRRLTYCAYLVHPLVTAVYYRSHRQKLFMTNLNIIYLFLGHLVITYMVAFVVFLAFQSPLLRLEKAVFTKDKEETK